MPNHHVGWKEQCEQLRLQASAMLDASIAWLAVEIDPCFPSSIATPESVEGEVYVYPDLIFGVVDCVANTAILTLHNVLYVLRQRQGASGLDEGSERPTSRELLGDGSMIEHRRRRAMRAMEFVRTQSTLAAKPLELGLQRFSASLDPKDARAGRDNTCT